MNETIAAISTAYGEGGIGIVRVSGENAKDIMFRVFRHGAPNSEKARKVDDAKNRFLYYGHIVNPVNMQLIDEVLVAFMQGPKTYTAEDVLEIYCHGSTVALRKILELTLSQGARMAEPGEFTKRAFLNGRLDLSQAEGVIDLINSKTEKSYDVALGQMEGLLSKRVQKIRENLTDMLVDIAVNIDYPDEDIEILTYKKMENNLSEIHREIENLLSTSGAGKIMKNGLFIAIAGKPNVGKSSLLNALLKESRAIVTKIPGTTRDTIEESVNIRGIPINIVDTAGIRETNDEIEKIGIDKSIEAFSKADFILAMFDGSKPIENEDLVTISQMKDKKAIALVNKTDKEQRLDVEKLNKDGFFTNVISISIKNDEGLNLLEDEIENLVYSGGISPSDELFVSNIRHEDLLRKAEGEIREGLEMIKRCEAMDFIEVNIHHAFDMLGEITGETANAEIIDEVFARFCLGK